MSSRSLGWARLLSTAVLVGAAAVVLVALFSAAGSERLGHDFRAYLAAAEAIRDGDSPYPAPESPIVDEGRAYVYPPLLAITLLPLTTVPVDVGALVDYGNLADLLATFCELAGTSLPSDYKHDGRSFAPQLRGEKGTPREWVYVGLHRNPDPIHWVRDDQWRLTGSGVLMAVHNAPFGDVHVNDSEPGAQAARQRLQKVLDSLE